MKRNMLVAVVYVVLALFSLLVLGCSEEEQKEQLTGAVVSETVSVLTVAVQDEDGKPIGDAEVFVNGAYKGKTNTYGESKGTKLILLEGVKNTIAVDADGFFGSKPGLVSATAKGEQKITITLEKQRSAYTLFVENELSLPVKEAVVSLFLKDKNQAKYIATTDKDGKAGFKKVDDGNYTVKITAPGYKTKRFYESLNYSIQGKEFRNIAELKRLPHLDVEVVDHLGRKMNQAEITLYTKKAYNTPGADPLHISLTDEQGTVSYADVRLEEGYVIIVKKEGFQAQIYEKTITDEDQFLHVGMEPIA